ncbi:MAG TPA: histidine phosphatase family protein [Gemmatimonadales bacterium]|nr:histidine phosphatase family protein [Gemmatimonadales bacterium]
MKLHLVRHGPALDADGRAMGHTDARLSPEGIELVARLVAAWPRPPGHICSSDLLRARETAEPIGQRWGVQPTFDARLREMNFGEWDGRFWNAIEREDADRLKRWMESWVTEQVPGGESFSILSERVREWCAQCLANPAEEVVVVAHAGSIRALLCHLLEVPLSKAFEFPVERLRISTVEIGESGARLLALNSPEVV